ncbi:hypothetical protein O3790_02575 [Micrococcus luteus]|uniref:hypothetical protein n=1 Tax=Micrococcus luteus TaxID=1270 RepID=UPI00352E714C
MGADLLHYDSTIRATVDDVRAAQELVHEAGLAAMLARWEAEDRQREGKRGARGAWASPEQIITMLMVLARLRRAQTVANLTALVVTGLTDAAVERLGLDARGMKPRAAYHRLQRSLRRMNRVMDPHLEHVHRHRKLSKTEFAAQNAGADAGRTERNKQRLRTFTSELLLATWRAMPAEVRGRYHGNIAVDGTFIPAWGKHGTYRRSDHVAIEPHADWYVRDGEHALDPSADAKEVAKKKRMWGWEATLAVMTTNDPTRADTFPKLVLGMDVDKPARSPGRNAIHALTPLHAAGVPAGMLIGDRAYGNTPKVQDFQRPARLMGYELLYDMKATDVGKVRMFNGVVMLEGNAYSPSILGHPELVQATLHFREGDERGAKIDEATYHARIAARARFLVQFRTAQRPDGSRQGLCPAAGPNPTVSCPLRPRDVDPRAGEGMTLMPVKRSAVPGAETAGPLCNNAGGTAVLKGEVWERNAMALQYGTRAWHRLYRTGRQTIESRNGLLKDDAGPQIAAPGRRRVRGQAALTVFLATMIAAHNLVLIERFLAADVAVDARGRGSARQHTTRRRDAVWGPKAALRALQPRAPGAEEPAHP